MDFVVMGNVVHYAWLSTHMLNVLPQAEWFTHYGQQHTNLWDNIIAHRK